MGHETGGWVGPGSICRGVRAKAATYTAGQCLVLDATNNYYELSTTRAPGAVVVAYNHTVDTDGDYLKCVIKGHARVKFDATCDRGEPVVPSDATAGNVEKWAAPAMATPSEAEIQAGMTYNRTVFAIVREKVTDTTSYFLIDIGAAN